MPHNVLVIGLGNTLRGDDALGRVAAAQLRSLVDPRSVKVIDQCSPTPELAYEVGRVSLVLFLDASIDGPRDRVLVRRVERPGLAYSFAHGLDAGGLLRLADNLYDSCPTAFAITFRGQSFALHDYKLSHVAKKACGVMVQEALSMINRSFCVEEFLHRASDDQPEQGKSS